MNLRHADIIEDLWGTVFYMCNIFAAFPLLSFSNYYFAGILFEDNAQLWCQVWGLGWLRHRFLPPSSNLLLARGQTTAWVILLWHQRINGPQNWDGFFIPTAGDQQRRGGGRDEGGHVMGWEVREDKQKTRLVVPDSLPRTVCTRMCDW